MLCNAFLVSSCNAFMWNKLINFKIKLQVIICFYTRGLITYLYPFNGSLKNCFWLILSPDKTLRNVCLNFAIILVFQTSANIRKVRLQKLAPSWIHTESIAIWINPQVYCLTWEWLYQGSLCYSKSCVSFQGSWTSCKIYWSKSKYNHT